MNILQTRSRQRGVSAWTMVGSLLITVGVAGLGVAFIKPGGQTPSVPPSATQSGAAAPPIGKTKPASPDTAASAVAKTDPAAGQTAASIARQATPAAAPTLPYLDRHGYHAVQLGPWRLKAPATLVSGAGMNSKVIAALPTGASLRALKVEILTVRPAVCEAVRDGTLAITQWVLQGGRQDTREIQAPIRRGDRVYELGYYDEGTCSIWITGATGLAECGMNGLSGGAPLCRYVGADKPVTDVWAYVAASNGQQGWIRNPKATGMSRHD